ncbi:sensor histidine kinase [Terricaulis silvestris]|uniref:histidine kinase n=1 Tax=Terricaulis silvestris TaxID=2686094 RepID=A0A6I6MJR4_9CAUL|nr:HAMP domain-containing sensor histidine kinase [Terricaulis silvestris]QGZ94909.1 Sensor protein TorS [Terricaulis silvestris]
MISDNETAKRVEASALAQSVSLGAFAETATRLGPGRISLGVVQTLVSAYWLGWPWAFAWCVAFALYEMRISPWLLQRFVRPFAQDEARRAERASVLILLMTSCLYLLGWLPAWLAAGPAGDFVAAALVGATLIRGVVSFSQSERVFFAYCSPPVLAMLAVLAMRLENLAAAGVFLAAFANLLLCTYFLRGRLSALVGQMMRANTERQAAEETSIAKTQFLTTMTHELRTPLNAVINYAEMIEEDSEGAIASDAGKITQAARRLLGLLDRILDFADLDAGKLRLTPTPIDVDMFIRDLIRKTEIDRDTHVALIFADNEAPTIFADKDRLAQCIGCLLANAREHTSSARIVVRVGAVGDCALISVEDTGPGIPADQLGVIFEAFRQSDMSNTRSKDGLGLGLAAARRIARAMGGELTAASTPGAGSCFTLRVPSGHVSVEPTRLAS